MRPATDPFRALYDANHERVRRILARIVGPQDADDLTQTVFAKAAKALPGFRGDADAATWLHRIAANAASDWLHSRPTREAKMTLPYPDAADDGAASQAIAADIDSRPSPEQELADQDMRDCIRGEIGKLSESLRTVLMLSALGGLADDDIAQTLGISHDAVKVRLHRARQGLKKIIEARCDFYRNELSCKPASPDCCAPPPGPAAPVRDRAP